MNNRAFMKALFVAMTMATICSGCVLPPALHKEGVVCELYETSTHPHGSTWKGWKISLNSHLQVDYKMPRIWRNFINVLNTDPTALQEIEMHLVNRGKDPLPHGLPYGCPHEQKGHLEPNLSAEIADFVFAFGIAEIDNDPSALPVTKSPHMLLYLPLHTKQGTPPNAVQEFRILFLHMEPKDIACTGDDDDVSKQRCEALKSLRELWESEGHSNRELMDRAADNIKRIIAPEFLYDFHNGVIHGTF